MKNLLLFIIIFTTIYSCQNNLTNEEVKQRIEMDKISELNKVINDTVMLNDGHLYYRIRIYYTSTPFHSQYCKNH